MISILNMCILVGCVWSAPDVVAAIGIFLGFISVLLSAIAIIETCRVRKQVALHDYKIKQHETVSALVNRINTFSFLIDFRKDGESDTDNGMFHRINLVGISKLERKEYSKYNEISVSVSDSFYFEPASEFVGSAYLPQTIAAILQKFMRQYPQKETTTDDFGKDFIFLRTGQYDESKKVIQQSEGIYADWNGFSAATEKLLQSITDWYKEVDKSITPNFICTNIVIKRID